MATPMRSESIRSRTPPVTARSMAPLTATCMAVMGAKGAAAATTPRYHPATRAGREEGDAMGGSALSSRTSQPEDPDNGWGYPCTPGQQERG